MQKYSLPTSGSHMRVAMQPKIAPTSTPRLTAKPSSTKGPRQALVTTPTSTMAALPQTTRHEQRASTCLATEMSNKITRLGLTVPMNAAKITQDAAQPNGLDHIISASRPHFWHWEAESIPIQCLLSQDKLEVCFHPGGSESAAAIKASEPIERNGNFYYWEVTVFEKIFGTSVMFGLCTKDQKLHRHEYCNLIGLDSNGWSLSHKGLVWHDGKFIKFTDPFPENQPVTVGILFNSMKGELSYFLDGQFLGTPFKGLNDVKADLYPVVGSTAKCTRIRITGSYCGFVTLFERSCYSLIRNASDKKYLLEKLDSNRVPKRILEYLREISQVCSSQTQITAQRLK